MHGDLLTRDLDGSEAATYLELEKPVGVLLCGVLHHVDDETDPAEVVRGWVDVVPAGSYFVLTYQWNPGDGSLLAQAAASVGNCTST
ncbi:SAM-dependent methyltransferase [Nocardia rhamnosiphila]|uniref:SAM-dependent methyltransferase n=1 Tax=Nocardia rhamnosiphila TaxID=426716 RepID=A0ABV2WXQ0_9NOCA